MTEYAPTTDSDDLEKDEPWIGVWIIQVRIFVTMLRGSIPIPGRDPAPRDDTLLKVANGEPCLADEIVEVLSHALDSADSAATEAGPLTSRVVGTWVRKEGASFRAAITSFANFYQLRSASESPVDVESAFAEWIRTNQPAVMERAVALLPALLFTRTLDVDGPRRFRSLMTELHQIRTSARRVAAQLKTIAENPVLDFSAIRSHLAKTADAIDPILDGHEEAWQATGRPADPFGPLLATMLRHAGFSNRDVGSALGVTADAVRKQVRRSKGKKEKASRQRTPPTKNQPLEGTQETRKP